MIDCLVAVNCLVYNHARFLRQCLDGFVMQKTDFKFIVLVHDDASTDSSQTIIEEYRKQYPDLFFPCYETVNQYSLGANALSSALRKAIEQTNAKYIAVCEGDDYWTVSDKLKRQVDFLEKNPDYSLCFHKAEELWDEDGRIVPNYCSFEAGDYELKEIFQKKAIPTASALYRREIYDCEYYRYVFSHANTPFRDNLTWYCCSLFGKFKCLDMTASVYRRHCNGIAISVKPITHMRFNREYLRLMKPADKKLAREQIFFDVPQLLLDYRKDKTLFKEVFQTGCEAGIFYLIYHCSTYYSKKIIKSIVSPEFFNKIKHGIRQQ